MTCPVCHGKGEIEGAFASFDGPVDKAVCPRCNGHGVLKPDGEPTTSVCPTCGSTMRLWRSGVIENGMSVACTDSWHDEIRMATSGETWPD